MTSFIPMIIGVGALVVFYLVYMTFFHKKLNAGYIAAGNEAKQKFDENKESLIEGYLKDRNKYGILTEAVGPEENILGIATYAEPKTIGKSLTEELKTSVTRVRKMNMDMFFMVITDKNLHCIESSGENTVDHTVFAIENISGAKCAKASPINLKNAVTGTTGDLNCFQFTYKDKKYTYNLYKYITGYPRFDVSKDTLSESFNRSFPGQEYAKYSAKDPVYQLETMVNGHFYEGFKTAAREKLGIIVP